MNPEDAVPVLLRRGLVEVRDIVQGDLCLDDASRRNRNFRVTRNGGAGYFLKHARPEWDDYFRTLRNEAAFYALVQNDSECALLQRFLPRFFFYDPELGILAVELCRSACTARELAATTGKGTPAGIAGDLACALGACHATFASRRREGPTLPPKRRPWVFGITRPRPDALREATSFQVELLKLLQQQRDLDSRLAELRDAWVATTVIHGDVRWDNVLVRFPEESPARRLVLIDWELAGLGDPAWDIGSAFQEYLAHYVASLTEQGHDGTEALAEAFSSGLPEVHREVRAFWDSYRETVPLPAGNAQALLEQSVRYCGASLLQAGFEWARSDGDVAVYLLQLGLNVLENPGDAQASVLGILSKSATS